MIIVSDTTPLRYLIEIDEIYVLEKLFGEVIIPEKVAEELQRPKTPQQVKDWMQGRRLAESENGGCLSFYSRKKDWRWRARSNSLGS